MQDARILATGCMQIHILNLTCATKYICLTLEQQPLLEKGHANGFWAVTFIKSSDSLIASRKSLREGSCFVSQTCLYLHLSGNTCLRSVLEELDRNSDSIHYPLLIKYKFSRETILKVPCSWIQRSKRSSVRLCSYHRVILRLNIKRLHDGNRLLGIHSLRISVTTSRCRKSTSEWPSSRRCLWGTTRIESSFWIAATSSVAVFGSQWASRGPSVIKRFQHRDWTADNIDE